MRNILSGLVRQWGTAMFLCLVGCATIQSIPDDMQGSIRSQLLNRDYWLRQSMYGGHFYDDERYRMMHPQPFEDLTFLKSPDGDIILPPASDEIIPMGTRIHIKQIEWPTKTALWTRPLYSPRYSVWIITTVAMDRGDVSYNRPKAYVVVPPDGLDTEKAFKRWFESLFSVDDTNAWLLAQKPEIQEAILHKKAVLGMDYAALTAALGSPSQISRKLIKTKDGKNITNETALYSNVTVVLEDGAVSKILKH